MIYNISYKYNLYVNFMLKLFKASIKTLKENLKKKNGDSWWGVFWYLLDPLMLFITFLFLFKIILKGTGRYLSTSFINWINYF